MDRLLLKKCLRCGGAVIIDDFYSRYERFRGCKCLICGEIYDPVILANRQMMGTGQWIKIRERQSLHKAAGR